MIAPRAGGVLETYSADPALLYGNTPGDGLVEAMDRALGHRSSPDALDGILARHRPADVSSRFFRALHEHLFSRDGHGKVRS
ncbi:hypothetical protein [Arenimonas daejeonensis]|uniref:hypothetical protein n=1 Tax=Arenimonas daejeonensis TaxID=370777 RepID=UPI00131517B8|nr:hypothetical protein [Arenimonas daejeonensis]